MQVNKINLIISISSFSLVILLILQFKWMLETAHIKEQIFNDKANIVLAKTTEALRNDKQMYQTIENCAANSNTNDIGISMETNELNKIDSIFSYYMKLYHIQLNYSYELIKDYPLENITNGFSKNSYNQKVINQHGNNGFNLKLNLPQKTDYIIAEMGALFVSSVFLILIVILLLRYTILSLLKEKTIAEHSNDFLNNMTHEFKTPLTNIALAGKMIIRDSEASSKTNHYSEIILKENEKLRLQVEQVLSMTALERGDIPIKKESFDFHKLIDEALDCMKMQIERKNAVIEYQPAATEFMVNADRAHFMNSICNLIDNAFKYCKNTPIVKIHTINVKDKLVISVTDNGIGIEKKYQRKIFHKFFRVPTGDIHDVKGFGLGLAYIKQIVEMHMGTIEVQSAGGLTTFIISIPNE